MVEVRREGTTPGACELQVALTLAEQLLRSGQVAAAIDQYRWAAACFVDRGEHHHALAVYLLLVPVLPHCLHTRAMVAEMHRRLGRLAEAAAGYEEIARIHLGAGRVVEAAQVYRLVVEIDPAHPHRRWQLGELYLGLGLLREGVEQLVHVVVSLAGQGRWSEVAAVGARILAVVPDHAIALRAAARAHVALGDHLTAARVLTCLLGRHRGDDEGREILGEAFAARGRIEPATRTWRLLAAELLGRGRLRAALRLAQRVLFLHPGDPEGRRLQVAIEAAAAAQRRAAETTADKVPPGVPDPADDTRSTNVLRLVPRARRKTPPPLAV